MELTFPSVNSRVAGDLAAELRLALIKAGAPPQSITIKPSSPENMDLGTMVSLEHVLLGIEMINAAPIICNFVKKCGARIKLISKGRSITIAPENSDTQSLKNVADFLSAEKDN